MAWSLEYENGSLGFCGGLLEDSTGHSETGMGGPGGRCRLDRNRNGPWMSALGQRRMAGSLRDGNSPCCRSILGTWGIARAPWRPE